jgi:hypothetical protein
MMTVLTETNKQLTQARRVSVILHNVWKNSHPLLTISANSPPQGHPIERSLVGMQDSTSTTRFSSVPNKLEVLLLKTSDT